jgi:putative ABC transport system permease protein
MRINLQDTYQVAFHSVWSHKFRSGLTILGIVIGITTVVTVASLLAGLRNGIVSFFQEFGTDNIFIARVSGDPSGANARQKELKRRAIRPEYAAFLKSTVHSIEDVGISLYITPPPGRIITAKVPGYESDNLFVMGASLNLYSLSPREISQGRLFTPQEEQRGQRVVLLGASLAEALYPDKEYVGRTMLLDGGEYRVVGVFTLAKGGFFGENGLDRQVVMPLKAAQMRYPLSENFFLTAKARPGAMADALEEVRTAMRKIRGTPPNEEDDFAMSSPESIIQDFNKVTNMILLVSLAISALGLLVGGIGVMNIMLVSVTERTREIGLRKAVGARRNDLINQFLVEAVALTGAGGLVGLFFSLLVTRLVSLIFPSLSAPVPIWAVVMGISSSVASGLFFGIWPAVTASRLDPVDALRYE